MIELPPYLYGIGSQLLAQNEIDPKHVSTFLRSANGMALLALLCNATAKTAPSWYTWKAPFVEAACKTGKSDYLYSHPNEWWVTKHRYFKPTKNTYLEDLNHWCYRTAKR